jgi:hypothetical protein
VRSKRLGWYIMAVLNYYRSEWTEISDDDFEYKLVLTNELKELLWACMRRKTNIPNAAKEVEIFFSLLAARDENCEDKENA